MLSTRNIVLSQDEVCEAVKAFVRVKYHEKLGKNLTLTKIQVTPDSESVTFLYQETLNPFIKKPNG